ncbi:hypothetical protein RIB2604_01807350 [Aspergillus luchuensis]|uniref:Uncharacterized protein n=1 Tax=Aspergillus kawachii TaxID=1069201 RepID=A0A146FI36_ASPKA|nr:hypothetical protein RIB2604_01807350 [Aspergillus luchuensis]
MKKSGQSEGAHIEGLDLCTPKKIPHTPPVTGGKTMGERVTARNTTAAGGRNVPADTLRHPFGTHQEGAVGLIVRAPVHLARTGQANGQGADVLQTGLACRAKPEIIDRHLQWRKQGRRVRQPHHGADESFADRYLLISRGRGVLVTRGSL